MEKIVECVPNFSEGKNKEVIDAITGEVGKVEGVKLLDVEPEESYNRVVVTLVGEPEKVLEAAFRSIAKAVELIDMSKHKGEHPRMGAADVVPFVPVRNVSMEECVELARRLGKRVAEELGVPVYLYEEAASCEERKNLASVRKGEYEGLAEKIKFADWKPDFGEAQFNPKSGATTIGARNFLIAYNVDLNTWDVKVANKIAGIVRESGRMVKDEKGEKKRIPGKLKAIKAIGVSLKEKNIAQVSMNVCNYKVTGLHTAFDQVGKEAAELGFKATASEIVGLTPMEALVLAGRHYTGNYSLEEEKAALAGIKGLRLRDFDAERQVVEKRLEGL